MPAKIDLIKSPLAKRIWQAANATTRDRLNVQFSCQFLVEGELRSGSRFIAGLRLTPLECDESIRVAQGDVDGSGDIPPVVLVLAHAFYAGGILSKSDQADEIRHLVLASRRIVNLRRKLVREGRKNSDLELEIETTADNQKISALAQTGLAPFSERLLAGIRDQIKLLLER